MFTLYKYCCPDANRCPDVFKEIVNENAIVEVNTRRQAHFSVNENLCISSLQARVTQAWANMPDQIKTSTGIHNFKIDTKQWIISKRVKCSDKIGCDLSCIDSVIDSVRNLFANSE